MRLTLARLVWGFHLVCMVFIAVAWSLPWSWALWAGLVGYPLVQLNWCAFGNRCGLTVLEERLRHLPGPSRAAGGDAGEPLHFVASCLSGVLGRRVSNGHADLVAYGFVWGGFAITALRLYARAH